MRTIGVVTVARSDFGIYLPVLRRIEKDSDLELYLLVSGMHLSPEFGLTVKAIEDEGFEIGDRIEMLVSSDTPEAIAKSIGLGVIGFGQSYARQKPDILLALGDRFEMLAAVLAALPYNIPVAHIHGGESTEGLIDEAIRHSLTKMSHLHFVSTAGYRDRVLQMGEEPWRVTVSGAPSLDNLKQIKPTSLHELERSLGFALRPAPLLVTFHPVTLEHTETRHHILELLAALEIIDLPVIFTYPNADTEGRIIIQAIDEYVKSHAAARVVVNLGTARYFSLMRHARAMIGNSSSGIIEAASFGLPVVNIGNRQRGRFHGPNVLDAPCNRVAISDTIKTAISPRFKRRISTLVNPYGTGNAAIKIVEKLKKVSLDQNLMLKRFCTVRTLQSAWRE